MYYIVIPSQFCQAFTGAASAVAPCLWVFVLAVLSLASEPHAQLGRGQGNSLYSEALFVFAALTVSAQRVQLHTLQNSSCTAISSHIINKHQQPSNMGSHSNLYHLKCLDNMVCFGSSWAPALFLLHTPLCQPFWYKLTSCHPGQFILSIFSHVAFLFLSDTSG